MCVFFLYVHYKHIWLYEWTYTKVDFFAVNERTYTSRAQSFYFSTQHYRRIRHRNNKHTHSNRASTYIQQTSFHSEGNWADKAGMRAANKTLAARDIACVCCRHRSAAQIFLNIHIAEPSKAAYIHNTYTCDDL